MKKENGAIMVESALIFPMVILTVMALIYLGLFKLQEAAILYQVQQVAQKSTYIVASPGYSKLGNDSIDQTDFTSDPSAEQVKAYYEAYHENLKVLYRELFGAGWADGGALTKEAETLADKVYLFQGSGLNSSVSLKRNFLTHTIEVKTSIEYPMPTVLQYFGFEGDVTVLQGASTVAMNPADFMRDVDFAWDATKAVCKELGLDGQLDAITSKAKELIQKFL